VLLIYIVKPSIVLVVIDDRSNLRKKLKIHCHLRYGYSVAVNQIVMMA